MSLRRVLLCLLWALPAFGQGLVQKRAELTEQLAAERAALDGLKKETLSVSEVLALLARRQKAAVARQKRLDAEGRVLDARMKVLALREASAQQALEAKLRQLGPRLEIMYRMTRRNPLDVLLSAQDFTELMRTSRALGTLVERDLQLLGDVRRAAELQRQALARLDGRKVRLAERLDRLDAEEEALGERRRELAALLLSVRADLKEGAKNVQALSAAERELAGYLKELESPQQGLGRLRGQLFFPLERGLVEVPFGRIVNPRFNTVVLQKGIDVRAAEGSPVRAVAEGTVVWEGWLKGYGNVLIVEHEGVFHSLVAHLGSLTRHVGDAVEMGEELGRVGDTGSLKGPFLYFELRHRGMPVDPMPWFPQAALAGAR